MTSARARSRLRKAFLGTATLLLLIVGGYYGLNYRQYRNLKHARCLKVGMPGREVLQIMGRPDTAMRNFLGYNNEVLYYELPWGASQNLHVFLTPDSQAYRVLYKY